MAQRWTLSELAALAGVSAETIKSFKKHGLLPPSLKAGRGANYGQAHVERLRAIGEYRQLGYSRAAIRAILENQVDDLPTRAELAQAGVEQGVDEGKLARSAARDPLFLDPNKNQTNVAKAWGRVKLFAGMELHYELGKLVMFPQSVEEIREAVRGILGVYEEE